MGPVCGICGKVFTNNQNLNRHVRTIHEKMTPSFSCTECDYSTSCQDNLQKHLRKRHNNAAPAHNIPPKIARQNTNIIEPTENEQFLQDIKHQELTDMLNTQVGLSLSQMPHTPPPSSPPPVYNNDPRQQEFERFFHSEQPWEGDVQLRNVYFRNFNLIRDSDQVHRRTRTYN